MKITLLGTGTPTPSLRRAGSSFLVETGPETFVFDCGPGSHVRLLEAGVSPTRVTQLFVSHWHYDHFTDLPHLLLRRWDQGIGRIPELKVYGPEPVERIMRQLFASNGVFGPDLEARTKSEMSVAIYAARGGRPPRLPPRPVVTEVKPGDTVSGDGWTVRAIETPHSQPYLRSLAYRLECPEGVFVYSGDSGPTPRMAPFAQGADVLVHMCHYLTGSQLDEGMLKGCGSHKMVAEVARDAGVKTLVLSHITEQMDVPGVRERAIHEIAEIFPGQVIWGEDGLRFTAGELRPAKLL
jgi:ribonuclease BN (tRNA processing enzyme)